jgi:Zn-finger nucleic acid-binding protein
MKCPDCHTENLKKQVFYQTEVDYCPRCLGVWFEEDELRQAKDEKDRDLNWLDIDLWKDEKTFKISKSRKVCPLCSVPLYEVNYGDSKIKVDVCNVCHGVWLERGEFKKVIKYLKEKEKYEVLQNYFSNLIKEGIEVFTGPEEFKSEFSDFLTLLKFLNYKLVIQYPLISRIISSLPK